MTIDITIKKENIYVSCIRCKAELNIINLVAHSKNRCPLRVKSKTHIPCPACKVKVRESRLKSHLSKCTKVKSKTNKKSIPSQYLALSDKNKTAPLTDKLKKTIKESREIQSYLRENPISNQEGKFGVPQDKFKANTYGLNSMEFNPWNK